MRWILLLLLALWTAPVVAAPSVIIILTDDQATWQMQALPRTRSLVGASGTTFALGAAPDPLCAPSRTSLLTGQYAHNHGIETNEGAGGGWNGWVARNIAARTFPPLLHDAGWRTGFFGKVINGAPDTTRLPGFDRFVMCHDGRCAHGYDYKLVKDGTVFRRRPADGRFVTDELRDDAVSFIRSTPSAKPLFVYFAVGAPHVPSDFATRHAGLYANASCPRTAAFNEADVSDKPPFLQLPLLTTTQITSLDAGCRNQLRSLASVDEAVGSIVNQLRDSDRLSESWIFFVSDHGYHMGDHRLPGGKNTLYATDIVAPFLLRGPGVVRGRIDATHLVANSDVAPTILAIAGLPIPSGMDGRSFLRIARGQAPTTSWRNVIPIHRAGGGDPVLPKADGVKTAGWTFTRWADGQCDLYRDTFDPLQLVNRCDSEPAVALRLQDLTDRLRQSHGSTLQLIEREDVP